MISDSTKIHRSIDDSVPFFIVSRDMAQDSRLGFDARGMLTYLLSKPENWTVNVKDLQRESGMGRDRVYRMINQCIELGYMRRVESRVGGSFAGTDIHVFSTPQLDAPQHEASPYTENPDTVKPDTVNQETYSKKNNTKKRVVQSATTPPASRRRATPEHMVVANNAGMTPRQMTALVNAVLEVTAQLDLANTDSIPGQRALADAQEVAGALVQMGKRTPEDVHRIYAVFKSYHPTWHPVPSQIAKYANYEMAQAQPTFSEERRGVNVLKFSN